MTLPKITLSIAKKLVSMILVAMLCVQVGCSVTESLSAGGLAERMRMLYKADIQFAHPPANDALAETKQIVIKSNEARTATTTQAFTSELQQAKIGEARYFRQVDFIQENTAPQNRPLFEIVVDKPDINSRRYQESRVRCPGEGAVRTCVSVRHCA